MRRPATRHSRPIAVAVAGSLALLAAACSQTGLSGTVPTTAPKPDHSTTTESATTTPSSSTDSGSTGGSGGSTGPVGTADTPGGFIIYQNPSTPSMLWRISGDGSHQVSLPPVAGQTLTSPLLSPDSSMLAFLATPIAPAPTPGRSTTAPPPAPKSRVWLSGNDGTNPHALTPELVSETCFAWSPDNTRLLVMGTDPTTNAPMSWIYSTNQSDPPGPSHLGLTTPVCPVFLGDNTVLYTGSGPGEDKPRPDQIFSRQLDGTPGATIASMPGCDITDIRPAPDNHTVAFAARCDDTTTTGLYVVSTGGSPQLIISGARGPFAWEPDGAWIAYGRADDNDPAHTAEILVAQPNGAKTKRLVGPVSLAPTWGSQQSQGGDGLQ